MTHERGRSSAKVGGTILWCEMNKWTKGESKLRAGVLYSLTPGQPGCEQRFFPTPPTTMMCCPNPWGQGTMRWTRSLKLWAKRNPSLSCYVLCLVTAERKVTIFVMTSLSLMQMPNSEIQTLGYRFAPLSYLKLCHFYDCLEQWGSLK